jgi:hypothetical protein
MKRTAITLASALLLSAVGASAGSVRIHNQNCTSAGANGVKIRLFDPKAPDTPGIRSGPPAATAS